MSSERRLGSWLVLGGRLLLLLGAVAAVVAAWAIGRSDIPGGSNITRGGNRDPGSAYACPMHPEATGSSASACPICGMALERVRVPSPASGVVAEEVFSVQRTPQNPLFFDIMFARKRPVAREMGAPAWIDGDGTGVAIFYDDEVTLLAPREEGWFDNSAGGGRGERGGERVSGRVGGSNGHAAPRIQLTGEPARRWDGSMSAVRFRILGGGDSTHDGGARSAGSVAGVGRARFAARTREMLVIPDSAVVQSAEGPYVLVAAADRHTFVRRPVELGRVLFGYVTVLGGLREGERVVAMNTFFLNSERRFGSRTENSATEATR